MNRIGPKMAELVRFVQVNPGCTPMQAAAHVGPHGSLKYGYAVIKRAVSHNLVVRVPRDDKRGCYRLYTEYVSRWVEESYQVPEAAE